MVKVLVADDEKLVAKNIKFNLGQDGMDVECAYDGEEVTNLAKKKEFDVMLLDVMLPEFDGYEVCQVIREFSKVLIIMLIAKSSDIDKILGLKHGADSYITKPFSILEVKARVKAILRENSERSKKAEEADKRVIVSDGLKPDWDSRRVPVEDKEINPTARKFDLLELLVYNPNKVYSREALLFYVWGNRTDDSGDVRTVDVHVKRLREKVKSSPSASQYIHTKQGVGYYFWAQQTLGETNRWSTKSEK